MATPKPPVKDGGQPAGPTKDGNDQREGAIRAAVLAALGRPALLYRVAVLPVGGDHFRVNVMTGEDPSSVRIPHSYFVAADGLGNITQSSPRILKAY